MLSRTADHLFWMCRYIERAENTARMLHVNTQMALLPRDEAAHRQSWQAMLRISELEHAFIARYDNPQPQAIIQFLVRDADNPSSIYACLRAFRENARAVRGSLTTELWETINTTWLTLLRDLQAGVLEHNPEQFFEWIKHRSHLVRGVIENTMLDDEALHFMRLGNQLERADNMARMLDVRFHEQHDVPGQGSATQSQSSAGALQQQMHQPLQDHTLDDDAGEFYRWSAILSCMSALEVYRKVYRDVITPSRVAELMLFNGAMPNSLLAAMRAVKLNLDRVANDRSGETQRQAGLLLAELEYGRLQDILHGPGLHHFLTRFLARINDLSSRISRDFLAVGGH